MRFAIPPDLSAFIANRIANYAAEATEPYLRSEAMTVVEFAALPLLRHWEETIGLRADGEVVRWSHIDHREPHLGVRPVEDRYDWLSGLVEGARRWPELAVLLPARPPYAVHCLCVNHPAFANGNLLCEECCGLRWVVPDADRG